jgi:signal transduction histidine kinase
LVFAAVAIGDTRRARRALSAAAAERATRLERDREEENKRRVQDARLSIARDVHDTVAHALVEINVHAGVTAHVKGQDPTMALAYIKKTSAQALNDLRTTLSVLRETDEIAPTAPALSLDAVPDLIRRAREAGLDAEADIRVDGVAVPSAVGQVGFRIVQEALTNVLRHADAKSTQVRIGVDHDDLDIAVSDDGRGGIASGNGHGLRGMSERIAALGGKLDAGPTQNGGWRIHARLPLTRARA